MDPCCDVEERLDQVPLLSRIASHRVPTIFKRFHVVAAGPRDMGRDTRSAHSISPADARPPQLQTREMRLEGANCFLQTVRASSRSPHSLVQRYDCCGSTRAAGRLLYASS